MARYIPMSLAASVMLWFGAVDSPLAAGDPQPPELESRWVYGATGYNGAVLVTPESGGFVLAGTVGTDDRAGSNACVMRVNVDGTIAWQQVYAGDSYEMIYGAHRTSVGDYLLVGLGYTMDYQFLDTFLKVNAAGELQWQKNLPRPDGGGTKFYSAADTVGGDYLLAGEAPNIGGIQVTKFRNDGELLWEKVYGKDACGSVCNSMYGGRAFVAFGAVGDDPGGCLVAGTGTLPDPDETRGGVVLLRLNDAGDVVWVTAFSNHTHDFVRGVCPQAAIAVPDGFVVTGCTTALGDDPGDAFVFKVGRSGEVLWFCELAQAGKPDETEWAFDVCPTSDGGYLIGSTTRSVGETEDKTRIYLVKTDAEGMVMWDKVYAHELGEWVYSVAEAPDGSYVGAGTILLTTTPQFNNGLLLVKTVPPGTKFLRGDANGDGEIDISDAVKTLVFLFVGGTTMGCEDAADTDDNGEVQITDAVATLTFLFLNGKVPSKPFPDIGLDPTTDDALSCESYGQR